MGFIYMFTSPTKKRYIGQTIQTNEERFKQHLQPSSGCKAIYGAIKKHGWDNMKKEWFEVPDDELNFYEEMLVELYETLAPSGYNLKEGGGSGRPCEEVKQKISKTLTGRTHTDEVKQKMSDGRRKGEKSHMFGKPKTDEVKEKISKTLTGKMSGENNPFYGRTHTDELKQQWRETRKGANNPRAKTVYQYDLDGTFVQSFATCEEATQSLHKSGTCISRCANGNGKTAYGFKWSFTKF
ncbi:GIY-YIG catalytic domain-containing endonuclease [Acanthocystis turfacea Chlorella virus Canal-1]|nr:GIY-YIG catalytic domain-containing endonuclease [Acanthocystis turfacea Chlorella virus Canal-1]